jgi:hypothetical protein
MVSPEAAKIAYDKAWAVFKAWPATDWSEARIKAFKAATGAWRVYLKAVNRIRPLKRQTLHEGGLDAGGGMALSSECGSR